MAPSNGPPDPQTEDEPAVPPPPPGAPDGVVGVAPHATIISIRQSSRAFEPVNPSSAGPNSDEKVKAGTLDSVARAVVHAANMGAKVINISVTACLPAAAPGDQRVLGAALWYAATVKDAVIVAAAGNDGEAGCGNNPMYDPLDPSDPRDWHQVTVVSSPSWFSDYVLSVGAVDAYGAALDKSMSGPWVGVAAPGTHIMGLSPQGGGPVNAYPPSRPGEKNMPFWGTSFSAAYVSGVAALVRAKFPELTAYQVINRIVQSAHNPPAGVDNKLGYGLVDPVAALTFNIPSGDRMAPGVQSRVITPAAPPRPITGRAISLSGSSAQWPPVCWQWQSGLGYGGRVDVQADRVQPAQCEAGRRGVDSVRARVGGLGAGRPARCGHGCRGRRRLGVRTVVGSAGVVVGGTGAAGSASRQME